MVYTFLLISFFKRYFEIYYFMLMYKSEIKQTIQVIKGSARFLFKIYNPLIILSVIGTFIASYLFPLKFVPDYFHFAKIENARTFIWSLIGAILGFSGLILTVVLVTYNFYLRSTRRNTFEFIIENPFLRTIFSFFAANVLVNVLGFFLVGINNNKVTILYFLFFITLSYILSLFPLAILSLKYSTSISRIEKLVKNISVADIDFLWKPKVSDDEVPLHRIEKNNVIILKDIGVNAIKDGDWVLPQTILNELRQIVDHSVKDPSKDTFNKAAHCLLFVCKHFKRAALKNGDSVIMSVLFDHALSLYALIADKQLLHFRQIDLDEFFKELCFNVIQSKDYPEIRDKMLRNIEWVLTRSLSKLNYTDDQLPTFNYRIHQKHNNDGSEKKATEEARYYWHYLTHTQIEILTDVIKYCIKQKDERVYDHFHWIVQSFIGSVTELKNLTEFQRDQYFDDVFYRLTDLSLFALEHEVYDNVEVISHIQLEAWIAEGKRSFYEKGLFFYSKLLKTFNAVNKFNTLCLDDFFMIGRSILHKNIDQQRKIEVLSFILDTGISLFETKADSPKAKYYIQHQLSWLMNILKEADSLLDLRNKYSEKVNEITKDYSYANFPN